MQSVTYAINRPIALLIREILRNTPLAHEWERAVMWDANSPAPASVGESAPESSSSKLHATVSVALLERLTEAVYNTGPLPAYAYSGLNHREVTDYVHRMQISAKRRLDAWD